MVNNHDEFKPPDESFSPPKLQIIGLSIALKTPITTGAVFPNWTFSRK